jgi:hypothetical protein
MKDDSGHFGDQPRFVEAFPSKPQVGEVLPKAEFVPLTTLEAGPSGWHTIPGTVRFAVWLWAIVTIVGFVAGCISLAVLLIGGGWALSQM